MFEQLGLIGCGLMGGSFALALKQAGLVKRVVGYSKSPSTTERARQMGVIDDIAPSALMAVSGADLVLLAVPVAATEATLKSIKQLVTAQTLVMDVGSTKTDVVHAARSALGDKFGSFVPAHPITGKEVAGVEHADAQLYRNAQVVLTPTERTLTAQLQRAEALWKALGCRVSSMAPETHDPAFAAVSHLPH
ncbi:MAG: prephenate dehydrogenase/arogenate dehydrogenase family protein, partial [Comamonas sp.]